MTIHSDVNNKKYILSFSDEESMLGCLGVLHVTLHVNRDRIQIGKQNSCWALVLTRITNEIDRLKLYGLGDETTITELDNHAEVEAHQFREVPHSHADLILMHDK